MLNEHDITKKMLNVIRDSSNKSLVTESSDNDSIDVNKMDMDSELSKITQQVSPRIKINSFKIYPKDSNAVLSGFIQDMDLDFSFTLSETDGLYTDSDNLQLTDNTTTVLNKLRGYYKNWVKDWSKKMNTDYKNK
jgi:hypothetical protein